MHLYLNFKKIITLVVLLCFTMISCNSNKYVFVDILGYASSFDNKEQFYDQLAEIKSDAENITKLIKEKIGTSPDKLAPFKESYAEIQQSHNKLVGGLVTNLKKAKQMSFSDYQDNFNQIKSLVNDYENQYKALQDGFIADSILDSLAIEFAKEALKFIAHKAALHLYANAFKNKYSLPNFDDIN